MRRAIALVVLALLPRAVVGEGDIPLPEHPRPDFERAEWVNLNGPWRFRFDPRGLGIDERWFDLEPSAFSSTILVPFPWGSKLSGVEDKADIGWYKRSITVPESLRGQRLLLRTEHGEEELLDRVELPLPVWQLAVRMKIVKGEPELIEKILAAGVVR